MAEITQKELNILVKKHEDWLKNEAKGKAPVSPALICPG